MGVIIVLLVLVVVVVVVAAVVVVVVVVVVRPCQGFATLKAKSDDPSTQRSTGPKARAATARALYSTSLPRFRDPRGQKRRPFHAKIHGSKSARRYRQSPLQYVPAKVSRPSRPKETTLPRKDPRVQKRAPLPPEPSRARPCHGFATLEAKRDDPSTQRSTGPKARAATARASRARPCHGFATLKAKSDDPFTQNPRVQKRARLPPEPSRARPCHSFAARETKSDDISAPLPQEPSRVRVGSWFVYVRRVRWCALLDVRWQLVGVRWLARVGWSTTTTTIATTTATTATASSENLVIPSSSLPFYSLFVTITIGIGTAAPVADTT